MPTVNQQPMPLKVAIAGLGAIGKTLCARLGGSNSLPGIELCAVAARDVNKARATLDAMGVAVPIVPLSELARVADVVIECAPAAILGEIAAAVLPQGKKLVVLSVGALLAHPGLTELARKHGGQIIVPTGALLGLDAVCAAAEGQITAIRMITRKPVRGLVGAPYLLEKGIDIERISAPLRVFDGTAREAAQGFPANLNVAVALSLAGVGPDQTRLEIWADPGATRNIHRVVVESDAARLDMTIENIPSENPKTGRITAQSVLALLRKMNAPLRVGT
jgi:aspartate dehydrogenase